MEKEGVNAIESQRERKQIIPRKKPLGSFQFENAEGMKLNAVRGNSPTPDPQNKPLPTHTYTPHTHTHNPV